MWLKTLHTCACSWGLCNTHACIAPNQYNTTTTNHLPSHTYLSMWALMPMLRCRGPSPSPVLMYRAATALAADAEDGQLVLVPPERADARDDGAAARAVVKRPRDAAATTASAEAGRWASARRRRVAAAMLMVGGHKDEGWKKKCSCICLVFCGSARMADEGKTANKYMKSERKERKMMMRGKGRLLHFWHSRRLQECRERSQRESGPVYRYPSLIVCSRSTHPSLPAWYCSR